MNIYLIRHGEKEDADKNHETVRMTEKGFMQADRLGKRLKQRNAIDKIYSSPMIRAVQTAETINKHLGVELEVREEIREIHMGDCEQLGWAYFEKTYPDFLEKTRNQDQDLRYPPDGENGADVWERAQSVIWDILDSGDENVAIVAHGGIIRVIVASLIGLGAHKRFLLEGVEYCSITQLIYDEDSGRFRLKGYNDYAHLLGGVIHD